MSNFSVFARNPVREGGRKSGCAAKKQAAGSALRQNLRPGVCGWGVGQLHSERMSTGYASSMIWVKRMTISLALAAGLMLLTG